MSSRFFSTNIGWWCFWLTPSRIFQPMCCRWCFWANIGQGYLFLNRHRLGSLVVDVNRDYFLTDTVRVCFSRHRPRQFLAQCYFETEVIRCIFFFCWHRLGFFGWHWWGLFFCWCRLGFFRLTSTWIFLWGWSVIFFFLPTSARPICGWRQPKISSCENWNRTTLTMRINQKIDITCEI